MIITLLCQIGFVTYLIGIFLARDTLIDAFYVLTTNRISYILDSKFITDTHYASGCLNRKEATYALIGCLAWPLISTWIGIKALLKVIRS